MNPITLLQVIEQEARINQSLNPFSDLFDGPDITRIIDDAIKNKYSSQVSYDQEGGKLIAALIDLNKIYQTQVSEITDMLSQTGLSSRNLIERIIASANFYYINVLEKQKNQHYEDNTGKIEDLNILTKGDFKNINGDAVAASDISDSINDSTNEIISILLKVNFKPDKDKPIVEARITRQLIHILQVASVLDAMKSNFKEFLLEPASISAEPDTITFNKTLGNYFTVKAANRIRHKNLSTEFLLTGMKMPFEPLISPYYKIEHGCVSFIKGEHPDQVGLANFVLSDFLTFHFHLHLKKLDHFPEYRINDLFKLFEYLRVFFFSFKNDAIIAAATATQNYHDIPYKINHEHLLTFLISESGYQPEFVNRFVELLSQSLSQDMDIWARPLIRFDNEFIFLLGVLAGGDLTYQFEHIVDKFITPGDQLNFFKSDLEIELDTLKHGYTFKKVDTTVISDQLSLAGLMVYSTLNHLVVLELCLIKYPLNSSVTADQMNLLFDKAETLNNNIQVIQKNLMQLIGLERTKITGMVITNHTIFSGMVVGKFPILDTTLFKNYVDVGKYTRAIIVATAKGVDSDALSSYPYYHDDESFDGNLLSYVYQPAPVHELLKNFYIKSFKLSSGEKAPLIFSQHAELQTLRQSMSKLVFELEDYLKQLYYFNTDYNKNPDGKRLISDRINFLTPLTFNYFAIDKTNRESRVVLLSNFKKVGYDGIVYLVNNLNKAVSQVTRKKIISSKIYDLLTVDHNKAERQFQEITSQYTGVNTASPSTFNFHHQLSDEDRNNLIGHIISISATFVPAIYTEEQLNDYYILVTIVSGLAHGIKRFEEDIYTLFLNCVDMLNYNGHFQKARDFSEEILAYSFSYESAPIIGWLTQFKCFTRQKSILDAAFYGGAYFAVLNALPEIEAHHVFDGLYNAMLFFRNFGFIDISDSIYKSLSVIPLESYQLQQVTLSFLNSKLQDIPNLQKHLQIAEDFLTQHILEITVHGQQGAMPWTAFIYNLINIESRGYVTIPAALKTYLTEFEKTIDEKTLEALQGQFFPDEKTSVRLLKEGLSKTYETRAIEDYVAEITSLEMLANNVAGLSLDPLDLDNLLLCGLVINDQSLTFQETISEGLKKFVSKEQAIKPDFEHYGTTLIDEILIRPGQVAAWVFELQQNVHILFIDEHKQLKVINFPNWNLKAMDSWLSKLPDYYFDEKNGYPINQQEGDYIDDLDQLAFAEVRSPFPFKELLVCFSLDLAAFPPNLLVAPMEQLDTNAIKLHEPRVSEHIDEIGYDLIGFHKPVSNIISLEYFAKYGASIVAKLDDLTLACWIPTVDDDYTLYLAENTLRSILEDKYGIIIQNSVYPKPALEAMINIFVAHGAKTVTGFRSVHTRGQNAGHALINETGISRVFGTGFIAVVFICDSGSMTKDIYNQKLISLVIEILSLGYKTVIAPAWRYNPATTAVWTETFVESLKAGDVISFAVQKANQTAAKNGFDEYFGFYSPRGWAAMHLYGNPNIIFQQ